MFSIFVFYQQLHCKNFNGRSEAFGLLLSIFAFAGMITGFVYLVYYGWTVVWWAAVVTFLIGLLATIPGLLLERVFGKFTLSLLGFLIWPVCAYFMFALVPYGT